MHALLQHTQGITIYIYIYINVARGRPISVVALYSAYSVYKGIVPSAFCKRLHLSRLMTTRDELNVYVYITFCVYLLVLVWMCGYITPPPPPPCCCFGITTSGEETRIHGHLAGHILSLFYIGI